MSEPRPSGPSQSATPTGTAVSPTGEHRTGDHRTGEHLLGRSLGRYALQMRVGSGGFARVYRAYDPELELDVALKLLKPEIAADPDTVERFRREASTAAKLRHPNVVTVLNVGRLDEPFDDAPAGTPYLVMDFLPDGLGRRLAERGALPEAELVRIGEDVARGLAYAHERGVIHRDVKPDNVLFAADGRALVTDFGIARAVDARATGTSRQVVLGTPSYFSPEQARGHTLDGRSDLYALGVTLYQSATGTLPFGGDNWYEVMRQHVESEPPPPRERAPHLSAVFEAVVLRCLAKDPADRFQSAGELADALAALRLHGAEAATMVLAPLLMPKRRRTGAAIALAGGVAAVAAVGAWLTFSDGASATRERLRGGAVPPVVDSGRPTLPAAESARTIVADTLPPAPLVGGLTVVAPPGARVEVDGRLVPLSRGTWRSDSVTPGPHVVRGTLRSLIGCPAARDSQRVDLVAGTSEQLTLRLARCGELELRVDSARARYAVTPLRVPGEVRRGELPLAAPLILPEGWYRLAVEASLCAPFNDSVRVAPGRSAKPLRIRLICD